MSQTSYQLETNAAFAGMLVDLADTEKRSYRNDDAVQIPFGLAVVQGAKDDGMKLPAAAADLPGKLLGVLHNTFARNNIGETTGLQVGDMGSILSKGPIWVTVEEAVVPTDPVYVRFTYGSQSGHDQAGGFRKSADNLAAWAATTAYSLGQRVVNGGNIYEVITAGTSAGSGGPTGTAADITDGTVHWKYVAAGAVGATAVLTKGARFLTSASAGGLAQLDFDAIAARLA